MNIIEATKKALKECKYIYSTEFPHIKMKPYPCAPFDVIGADGKDKMYHWRPRPEDILSDNWEVCD